jgi:hypothetical protein
MQNGVNTVNEYFSLAPVFITPGPVGSVDISGNPLNKNLRIDYTIKFIPTNKVPTPGRLRIHFPTTPTTYKLDAICRVIDGLDDEAGNTISCTTDGTSILYITNFAEFSP